MLRVIGSKLQKAFSTSRQSRVGDERQPMLTTQQSKIDRSPMQRLIRSAACTWERALVLATVNKRQENYPDSQAVAAAGAPVAVSSSNRFGYHRQTAAAVDDDGIIRVNPATAEEQNTPFANPEFQNQVAVRLAMRKR